MNPYLKLDVVNTKAEVRRAYYLHDAPNRVGFALNIAAYISNVLQQPWPEEEQSIMQNIAAFYHYAKFVLKRRWRVGEPFLIRNIITIQ